MGEYEAVLVLAGDLDSEAVGAVLENVAGVISKAGGSIEGRGALLDDTGRVDDPPSDWKPRRLAFPISQYTEAYYAVLSLRSGPEGLASLERWLRLNESVLRHSVCKRDGS
jgi:small subunit ribosomal protein S6